MVEICTAPKSWGDLQIKTAKILVQSGLSPEVEQNKKLVRGAVEIDVYAEEKVEGRILTYAVECKFWKSTINQSVVHAFRSVMSDGGFDVGIIVTISKFQKGAYQVAKGTNIRLLTWEEFQDFYFQAWYNKYFLRAINSIRLHDYQLVGWFDDLTKEDRSKYFVTRNLLSDIDILIAYFVSPRSSLPVIDAGYYDELDLINTRIPREILEETNYEIFLQKVLDFSRPIIKDFNDLLERYETEETRMKWS